jgi:hypothetical protein
MSQLELELEDLKNPRKAAVRGLFAFGKKTDMDANYSADGKNYSAHGKNHSAHGKTTPRGKDAGSDEAQEKNTPTTVYVTENANTDSVVSQLSEPRKLGMKSLWSVLASPLTPKSLRGFKIGDRPDKTPLKEAPIHEKDESDEEENRNSESASAGHRDDELSIEDELKAIENEIQVPSADIDSLRDDEPDETHDEIEKATENGNADVSEDIAKGEVAKNLAGQAEDEKAEENANKSPEDEHVLGNDDDDATPQDVNLEDGSGGDVALVSIELAEKEKNEDQESVGTGDSAAVSQADGYSESQDELDADDYKDSCEEGGSGDDYESDNANSLADGEADDRSEDLQNSAASASLDDNSESWDDGEARNDMDSEADGEARSEMGSEADEGEALENGNGNANDSDGDESGKKEGNVVFV